MAQETISLKKGYRKIMSGVTINDYTSNDKCNVYEVNNDKNKSEVKNLTVDPSKKNFNSEIYHFDPNSSLKQSGSRI
ncbi:hypothetical protein SteCoe_19120 [Stentor coeruleus]|uniref:Uncharacterized protein n=1 Tax=Stentor coeruleus TaxID=5963 RepID=A0A1R2BUV4_9CILI|nr:hypothetical protein SteCoe_19120 [Stentor coeruleus]